jgi:RHS repeat-associated protein
VTEYQYYAATDTADNPCTVAVDPVNQGGMIRYTIDPTAQTGKKIVAEQVYDILGRAVASRRGTQTANVPTWEATWSCTTFDARQRPTSVTVPNVTGTAVEWTVTTNYKVGGNPLKTSVTDSGGTITSESDLISRGVSYTDVWGTVTASTYDTVGKPGRLAQTTVTTSLAVLAATHAWDYDRAGRLTRQYLDGNTIAIPAYNAGGTVNEHTLASVSYPSGVGNAGNNTSLASMTRNTSGAVTGLTWNQGATGFFTNTVARSRTGRITSDSVNGTNTSSFEYDTAGRLSKATQPGHVLQYQYGAQTGCTGSNLLANAGFNTNRTALIDNGSTIASYCYDTADRLVSTTAAGYGSAISYDNHGNTTTLGGDSLSYDGADRHVSTSKAGTSVTYTRDASDRIVSRTSVTPVAPSAVAFRGAGANSNNGVGATSITVASPATAVVGDLLLATISVAAGDGVAPGSSFVAPTVATPAGWTLIGSTMGSTNGPRLIAFRRFAATGDPASWTFTLAASGRAVGSVVAYSGVNPTAPIDAFAVPSGPPIVPQVTTTGANRMVLTIVAPAGTPTITPDAGTTQRYAYSTAAAATSAALQIADALQAVGGLSPARTVAISPSTQNVGLMTIALAPAGAGSTAQTVQRYSYSGGADATALTLSSSNVILDVTISLPGGLVLTKSGVTQTWAYPNIHGDVTYTIDQAGVKTGPFLYDPYGQPLSGVANTSPGEMDNGWLGQHQRPYEHQPGINPLTEMGARPYSAALGRFLRVDPVKGGCSSDYTYVDDPINGTDLTGTKCPGWVKSGSRLFGFGDVFRSAAKIKNDLSRRKYLDALKEANSAAANQLPQSLTMEYFTARYGVTAAGKAAVATGAKALKYVGIVATAVDAYCTMDYFSRKRYRNPGQLPTAMNGGTSSQPGFNGDPGSPATP